MSTPSLNEVSDRVLEAQARSTSDGVITTEVEDVTIYPAAKGWWITITCGNPFNDCLARIELNNPPIENAFEKINEIYNHDFTSIDGLCMESIEIDLNANHSLGKDGVEANEEIETPVRINGYRGRLATLPTSLEYQYNTQDDAEAIQERIEKEIRIYNQLTTIIEEQQESVIRNIIPKSEDVVELYFENIPDIFYIQLTLPPVDKVSSHPVSEFIRTVGSGKLENLENSMVYLNKTGNDESIVGCDTLFEKYGVSATPIEPSNKSNGLLSRFF